MQRCSDLKLCPFAREACCSTTAAESAACRACASSSVKFFRIFMLYSVPVHPMLSLSIAARAARTSTVSHTASGIASPIPTKRPTAQTSRMMFLAKHFKYSAAAVAHFGRLQSLYMDTVNHESSRRSTDCGSARGHKRSRERVSRPLRTEPSAVCAVRTPWTRGCVMTHLSKLDLCRKHMPPDSIELSFITSFRRWQLISDKASVSLKS